MTQNSKIHVGIAILYAIFLVVINAIAPYYDNVKWGTGIHQEYGDFWLWQIETIVVTPAWFWSTGMVKEDIYRSALNQAAQDMWGFSVIMLILVNGHYSNGDYYAAILFSTGVGITTFYKIKLGFESRRKLLSYVWKRIF